MCAGRDYVPGLWNDALAPKAQCAHITLRIHHARQDFVSLPWHCVHFIHLCAGRDSNPRRRMPADLQSAPFDRFGTCAKFITND